MLNPEDGRLSKRGAEIVSPTKELGPAIVGTIAKQPNYVEADDREERSE